MGIFVRGNSWEPPGGGQKNCFTFSSVSTETYQRNSITCDWHQLRNLKNMVHGWKKDISAKFISFAHHAHEDSH